MTFTIKEARGRDEVAKVRFTGNTGALPVWERSKCEMGSDLDLSIGDIVLVTSEGQPQEWYVVKGRRDLVRVRDGTAAASVNFEFRLLRDRLGGDLLSDEEIEEDELLSRWDRIVHSGVIHQPPTMDQQEL